MANSKMRGILAVLALFAVFFIAHADIDADIENANKKLAQNKNESAKITQRLDVLGKQINAKNAEIIALDSKISVLKSDVAKNENSYKEQVAELERIKRQQARLEAQKAAIQKELVEIVANALAFYDVSSKEQKSGEKEVVLEQVYGVLKKDARKRIAALNAKQAKNHTELVRLSGVINMLENAIKTQKERHAALMAMHKEQALLVENLEAELAAYNQKLKDADKERQSMNEILSNLKITKQKKIDEAKREAAAKNDAKKEESSAPNTRRALSAPIEVRKVASSYRDISTTKYKGKKTIAPLENYTIEQKFGQYFDPVYKIKVFSESVVLAPKMTNANVRAVLDGKVVFAKSTPMLKRVVVVEHDNELHTIYTHLDKLAPNIKAGSKIKKGFVIGKVDSKLGFETTLKDKHFDPLELVGN